MRHPEILTKLRIEVSELVAAESTVYTQLDTSIFRPSSLPYATAIFYEALRLYPPVPFELKQCEKPTTLPDGTFLPKNAVLMWCTWAMNRSKLIWGQDSETFEPGRWLENGTLISKTAFEYPVFNGGPRTCLGKKMAEMMAVQVIATCVSTFDFVPIDSQERISKNSLTLPMQGGLPCHIKLYD
jgi:cytochrome P450